MIMRLLLTALMTSVSLVLVGCAGSGGSSSRPSAAAGQVDAQVFSDVVEWAFPLPGATSQDRVRRITNFIDDLDYKECGAAPAPLDYVEDTAGDEYPDLELIRTRGLGPIYDSLKYYHLKQPYGSHQSPRCTAAQQRCKAAGPALNQGRKNAKALLAKCRAGMKDIQPFRDSPAFDRAFDAGVTWQDETMLTVANTEAVLAAARPMARCLRRGSGLHVTDDDPDNSFLGSVDVAYFRVGSTVTRKTMWKWSRLYADCAATYFAVVKRELLKQRPAMVERYREQLEALAAALVKAGYVP